MLNHPVTALQEGNKTVDRISAGYLMYAHGEMISLIIDYWAVTQRSVILHCSAKYCLCYLGRIILIPLIWHYENWEYAYASNIL